MQKLALIVSIIALLCGCVASTSGPDASLDGALVAKTVDDKFSSQLSIVGPTQRVSAINLNPLSDEMNSFKSWYLQSQIDRATKTVNNYVVFSDDYTSNGWKVYDAASNEQKQDLSVTSVSRDVISCVSTAGNCHYIESILIKIDAMSLSVAAEKTFSIKLYPKQGDPFVMTISSEAAIAQVKSVRSALSALKTGS